MSERIHFPPAAKIDRAVARIQRWGTDADRDALYKAIDLQGRRKTDQLASRLAILEVAKRVKVGRRLRNDGHQPDADARHEQIVFNNNTLRRVT